jgi:uncharacterized phiE125 gp8 family phage protein
VLKVITAATQEPITLAEAKTFLRVDTTADDTLISSLISAAREYAEQYTQATFAAATYELGLDGFPLDAINLPSARNPVIVSVKYFDSAGVDQTLSPTAYLLSDYGMQAFIYPAQSWPATGIYTNAVRVRYTDSGTAASGAVKVAILELVAHLYENRENAGTVPDCVYRLLDIAKGYL